MNTTSLQKLNTSEAIKLWNDHAFANSNKLTLGHNPQLFYFFEKLNGLRPIFFLLLMEGNISGLTGLVLCGKKFISLPHFSHGGLLRTNSKLSFASDEEIVGFLTGLVKSHDLESGFYQVEMDKVEIAGLKNKQKIEIRQTRPLFGTLNSEKVVHTLPLKKSMEEQYEVFSQNLKRKINKSKKNGIHLKTGTIELVDDFTKVYNKNMHQLGSPTLGKTFFKKLCATVPGNCEITVAYLYKHPVGGGFCMWYDGYFENTWFSTLQKYNHLYTSYALHNQMIKNSILKNAHTYSFGRSTKDSGVYRYKLQWPVEEKELFFNTSVKHGLSLKDQKWLTKIWKRLPAGFVNFLGPYVAEKIY